MQYIPLSSIIQLLIVIDLAVVPLFDNQLVFYHIPNLLDSPIFRKIQCANLI